MNGFGMGYSSFALLTSLSLSFIKIDRSFVRDFQIKERGTAVVGAIVHMAHALDLPVVAEGVETDAQLNVLKSLHCDQYQGSLLGKPVQAEEMMHKIRKFSRL
jgi:EAL domain-containing protein (putative c-di-GMP-specific phosphodiesterase class I)